MYFAMQDVMQAGWNLICRRAVRVLDRSHSHWICSARFNTFHEQLVLSGGSDNIVNLWRVAR